jgi:hypothetical protein
MKRTGFSSQPKPMAQKSRKRIKQVSDKRAEEKHPLRDNAEGKSCTLRLPGCRHDSGTVVFAHYRRFSWGGMGLKPNDLLGCFACDSCHEKQEHYHEDATYEDMLRAMGETLLIQLEDGIITVGDDDEGYAHS